MNRQFPQGKINKKQKQIQLDGMMINEWGWVGYEELNRSGRVLSTEAEGGGG